MATAYWYPDVAELAAAEDVSNTFRKRHGFVPDGVWGAPGRVNLIGEHVDYNGGRVLPFALAQRTYAAVSRNGSSEIAVSSVQASVPWQGSWADLDGSAIGPWAGYLLGVAWAMREAGHDVDGFWAVANGMVPQGSGLSSSAAMECSLALALSELHGLGLGASDAGRQELAHLCVRAENDIVGAPTGGMDQAVSLRATAGHALLLDCATFEAEQVPVDFSTHGLELLVIDSRAKHELVDGQYAKRREGCHAAAGQLGVEFLAQVDAAQLEDALAQLSDEKQRQYVRHVVTEIDRVNQVVELLRSGRARDIGPHLDASHASLRDDYQVSCRELDLITATARSAGALGARMTGGGFGGSAIALIEAGSAQQIAQDIAEEFARAGLPWPCFTMATPSAGAERLL